jgi:hypothetical protein
VITCPHCGEETPLRARITIAFDPAPDPAAPAAPPAAAAPPSPPSLGSGSVVGMPRYYTGGEVRVRDRVRYRDGFATVVFVSNGEHDECAPGHEDQRGHDAGIIICDDDGETTFLRAEDPNLEMMHR